MKKSLLFLSFFILLLLSINVDVDVDVDYEGYTFAQYLIEHQKSYPNEAEHAYRSALFETRLQKIIAHNKNPSYTWKEGVNQFTDMTDVEIKGYLGLNKALLYQTFHKRGIIPQRAAPVDPKFMETLPDNVDWRTAGIITNVKNQGNCGSCWSFGAAEGVESLIAQQSGTRTLTILSEQNILDCTPNPNHCGGTGGCGGSTVELAWDRIITNGIATEKDYPYLSGNSGRDYTCKTNIEPFANITAYVNLPSNQQDPILNALANWSFGY